MKHKPFLSSFTTLLSGISVIMLSQCNSFNYGAGAPITNHSRGTQYLWGYGSAESQAQNPATYQPKGYWDGDGVHGKSSIHIVRHEQKAYFYKGDKLVGMAPISSGDLNHETPAGRYKVTQKDIDHVSSAYGIIKNKATGEVTNNNADIRIHKPRSGEVFKNAPMPYFLRFNHGIGMHTGFLPGYAASHGCVRLPNYMAKKFFENSKLGTPVIVK